MTENSDPIDGERNVLSAPVSRRRALGLVAAGLALPAAGSVVTRRAPMELPEAAPDVKAVQQGALAADFDPMDPAVSSNGVTINLMFYVYESLYRAEISSPTKFVPELAEGSPHKVNNKTYKVKLRSGAKFQDGTEVTAEDVVFSFDRLVKQGANSFLGKYITNFSKMVATSKHEVTVHLHAPMALLEQRLAVIRVLSKKAVTSNKNALLYKPVGSGPLKVKNAVPSSGATLVKWSGYNGPLRHDFPSRELNFSIVTDPTAQLTGLESGKYDAIAQFPLTALASLKHSKYRVAEPSGHAINGLLFNAGKAPFNDYRVRQAIMYGIDRTEIIKAAYFGAAKIANALVPPDNADYTRPSTIYTHNPAKAKALLKAAKKSGLSFELMAPTNIAGFVTACEIMQQQLSKIGVNVSVKQVDIVAGYSNVTNGVYESFYVPSSPAVLGSADAEFIYRWLYYGAFATQYMFWKNAEAKQVAHLLDEALTSKSYAAYKKTMARVINIVAAKGPFAAVVLAENPIAWNPKTCSGITPSHLGNLYFGRNL